MKNIILLTLDSFTAEALNDEQYGKTAMPFFKSLINKSIYAENYYSEGPHTEMGLQAMMTGMDTLDNSASLRRFVYADNTMYDSFYNAGYKLAKFDFPSNYYPKRFYGIIEDYFMQGDCFIETIIWRLMYYVDLYKKGELQEQDYTDLIGCFEDSFNSYMNFLNTEVHTKDSYYLIQNRIRQVNLEDQYSQVIEEYKLFSIDKRSYVENIIKNDGKLPKILTIDNNDTTDEENNLHDKLKKIYTSNIDFFRKLERLQKLSAFTDNRTSVAKVIDSYVKYLKKEYHGYIASVSSVYKHSNNFKIYCENREHIDSSSLKTQLSFLSKILEKNKECEQPYFVYLHTISQHDPTQWLSLDQNEQQIQKEIDIARNLIKSTKNYHGYYAYRLGLRYIDECLEAFFKDINEKGILDKSIVVITADHGSSVCMNPVRDEMSFNNCHTELFHIPLVIYEKGRKPEILKGYYTHRDLLPTLLEICGIKDNSFMRGHSILDKNYKPSIALSERTPSGAPTLLHKDAIYTVRNKKYLIEYRGSVFKPFESGKLTDVYDLENDRWELQNLVDRIDRDKIKDLLEYAKKRHIQLSDNYINWLKTDMQNRE